MGKVDIKEELAVQSAATENTEKDGSVRLTKNMSIQDMVNARKGLRRAFKIKLYATFVTY